MGLFFAVLMVFILVFVAMGVGVMFRRPPIAGSCGGLNNLNAGSDEDCQICGAPVNAKCRKKILES